MAVDNIILLCFSLPFLLIFESQISKTDFLAKKHPDPQYRTPVLEEESCRHPPQCSPEEWEEFMNLRAHHCSPGPPASREALLVVWEGIPLLAGLPPELMSFSFAFLPWSRSMPCSSSLARNAIIIKTITIVINIIIIFLLNLPGEQLASERTGLGQRQDCRARRGSRAGSGTLEPP